MSHGKTQIFRERTSVVCVHEHKLLVFRAIDPQSQREYLFVPGGGIEEGETLVQAAERETLEETGYRVRVDQNSRIERRYPFRWNGKDHDCLTHFFRGELAEPYHEPQPVQDAPYNHGPQWIPVSEISKSFAYSPGIREALLALL